MAIEIFPLKMVMLAGHVMQTHSLHILYAICACEVLLVYNHVRIFQDFARIWSSCMYCSYLYIASHIASYFHPCTSYLSDTFHYLNPATVDSNNHSYMMSLWQPIQWDGLMTEFLWISSVLATVANYFVLLWA